MVDRDAIEKALLINVVRDNCWDKLILNGIDEQYFTTANKQMYSYIKGFISRNEYPNLKLLCFEFKLDDTSLSEYIEIGDVDALCNALKNEYLKSMIQYKLGKLNDFATEMSSNPITYVDRLGQAYNDLKVIGYENKTVDILEGIDDILKIDPSDVISTGFKELDEKLIGWKRGEELGVFMARTGQR